MVLLTQVKSTALGYSLSLDDYVNLSEDGKTNFLHDFIYQSNYMEGISDHWVQTVQVGEKPFFPPTLISHEKAFELMMQNATSGKHPMRNQINKLHRILMEGLLQEEDRGHLRQKKVIIAKKHYDIVTGKILGVETIRKCPDPKSLPYLIKCYEESVGDLAEKPAVTQEDLLENHAYFE